MVALEGRELEGSLIEALMCGCADPLAPRLSAPPALRGAPATCTPQKQGGGPCEPAPSSGGVRRPERPEYRVTVQRQVPGLRHSQTVAPTNALMCSPRT